MAEPDKIPETQSDTQAPSDLIAEEASAEPKAMDNSLLSESQDFQLIDCSETQQETQNETESMTGQEIGESKTELPDPTIGSSPKMVAQSAEANLSEPTIDVNTTEKIYEMDQEVENPTIQRKVETKESAEDTDSIEAESKKQESKELLEVEHEEDDEDDFVQSSQLENLSPLKKHLSDLSGVLSQKRKAENTDETVSKFPRTCSQEDALTTVRKRLDEDTDDIFSEERGKERNDDEITSNIIIAETQESVKDSESLQQVEQELEETLSQHPTDEEDKKIPNPKKQEESFRPEGTNEIESCVVDRATSETKNRDQLNNETDKSIPKVQEDKEVSILSTVKEIATEESDETNKIIEPTTTKEDTKEKPTNSNGGTPASSQRDEKEKNTDSQKIEAPPVPPTSTSSSRMSIEVIYDRSTAPPEKKPHRELVEIDEDGEKIVLDSSQESCDKTLEKSADENIIVDTSFKTCASTDYKSIESSKDSSSVDHKSGYSLTNGSNESRIADSDLTASVRTEFTSDTSSEKKIPAIASPIKKMRLGLSKIADNPEVFGISDSEESLSFVAEERPKLQEQTSLSLNHDNSTIKTIPIEKELSIIVKLKCLVYVDETTKEHVEKVITGIHCESGIGEMSTSAHRNSDNSANLADISGNEKDTSPGSVTSIPHPYPLNPRLSIASTSSSSSAGSLNAKITGIKFQLPRGPAKHAKKIVITDSTSTEKRLENEEILEQIKKEWKNVDTLTCTIMNFASQELNNTDHHNGSALRVDNSLERIRSSTPEVVEGNVKMAQSVTPKRATKRSRTAATTAVSGKPTRAKNLRSSNTNGLVKDSPIPEVAKTTPSTSKKRKSSPDTSTPTRQSTSTKDTINDGTNHDENEELVGKEVFAKWSDNKYYPGTVTAKVKTKYRVVFYDGQSKLMIEDFIVPMPSTLTPGLSVYATSDEDFYGSCGIILEVKKVRSGVNYIVETDDNGKAEVDIKNIFLTHDQVQVLKDETKVEMKTPPTTPKHLGKITLDNVIDGKRRSKRILTPLTTTPKSKRGRGSIADKMVDLTKPSASGISTSYKFDDNHGSTSDSTFSGNDDSSAANKIGVQEEIIGTPHEQDTKGPQSSIKGKGRGRKKSETPEIIANLGPLPEQNSELFKGMSFILSCASLDTIERYQARESSKDRDSNSDPGTENEEEWTRKPFVRERLVAQLIAGGGKVYDNFESIPSEEYGITKHITNVPNTTRTSLLCLSVGIKPYNHQWVIRCCQENKIVNPSEEELPAGWSVLKKSYIDMFQRRTEKPFQTLPVIFVIPVTPGNKEFVSFWQQICKNAGGSVVLVENPDDGFIEGTVVLTNKHCPTWVVEKASSWNIPLVSTIWIIECLVEGNICSDDAHPNFEYNYSKKPSTHISHRKRR